MGPFISPVLCLFSCFCFCLFILNFYCFFWLCWAFVAACGLLIVSLGLWCSRAQAQKLWPVGSRAQTLKLWHMGLVVPWCGVFPVERISPALAGGFFTIEPPGKFSLCFLRNCSFWSKSSDLCKLVFSVISLISSGSVVIIPVFSPDFGSLCIFGLVCQCYWSI